MKTIPSLEQLRSLAAEGVYRAAPVACELLSDRCTPIEVLRVLKNVSSHVFLLESVAGSEKWGRWTFLGFDPKLSISCKAGDMRVGDLRFHTEDPSAHIRQILSEHKSPRIPSLPPFTGGLVGYFSYDYLGYAEPQVRTGAQDTEDFQDVDLMLFDKVIAFDNFRQKLILMVNVPLSDVETGYNKALYELKQLRELILTGEKRQEPRGRICGEAEALFDRAAYCSMVERAGVLMELVRKMGGEVPILGVCLGHQAICAAYGTTVTYARQLMHGKQSLVTKEHDCPLFPGCPERFPVARYHSLAADPDTLPDFLQVTARTADGEVMAVQHRAFPVFGVQFHPESIMTPDGKTMLSNFLQVNQEDYCHD